jgi:hypothetical protein
MAPHAAWAGADPIGVWLSPRKFAIQTFDWNIRPIRPARSCATGSTRNQRCAHACCVARRCCGGWAPAGPTSWAGGRLYNPDDGRTYRITAELASADVFVTRVYLGIPLFGENRTFQRVPRLTGSG